MENWKFVWNENTREVLLESTTHIIKIKADKIRKWFDKNEVECKKVGQFKLLFLNGMDMIPKSYYTTKEKKQQMTLG